LNLWDVVNYRNAHDGPTDADYLAQVRQGLKDMQR
jgi:hypothetical protein